MNLLVDIVLGTIHSIPGMALRAHSHDGRMGRPLQALMLAVGVACLAACYRTVRFTMSGLDDGSVGIAVALLLAGIAGSLLIGGAGCVHYGVRNPAPPALPDNVIPLRRTRPAPGSTGTSAI